MRNSTELSGQPGPVRKEVVAALSRILHSPAFKGSKRCQELLEFLVAKRLDGDVAALKERVIGAELFSRDPAYDTSTDAIVRVKANEVRKRLAAYYGQEGRRDAIRIELPVGSYVPVFRWLKDEIEPARQPQEGDGDDHPGLREPSASRWLKQRRLAVGLGALLAAVLWAVLSLPRRPADRFWARFYESKEPVLLCIPARERWFFDPQVRRALAEAALQGTTRLDLQLQPGNVAVVPSGEMSVQNFRAVTQLAIHLAQHRVPMEMRLVAEVSAEAIRRRQVILLGAYHNPWAMELSSRMRYSFESAFEGSRESAWVRDRNAPGPPRWKVPRLWPYAAQSVDYAIITRTLMSETGQVVVSLAGINGFGTQVAAEFLTGPQYWRDFSRLAGPGWEHRNFQIVLETKIVRDVPNPPQIVAAHLW